MARLEGFEPPTNRIGTCYSIQLSYRRVMEVFAGLYTTDRTGLCQVNYYCKYFASIRTMSAALVVTRLTKDRCVLNAISVWTFCRYNPPLDFVSAVMSALALPRTFRP